VQRDYEHITSIGLGLGPHLHTAREVRAGDVDGALDAIGEVAVGGGELLADDHGPRAAQHVDGRAQRRVALHDPR
jgi:hypothetical protein